jgi:hypothetical protein
MDKKGIMIKFLTTVLLAIIIFAPACYVASSFFRLSDQAKDNFIKFVDKVKSMENEISTTEKIALLIMDEGTAVVYFEPYQKELKVSIDATLVPGNENGNVILKREGSCLEEKGCLCLFREPEYSTAHPLLDEEVTYSESEATDSVVTDRKKFCQEIDVLLKMDCNIGVPTLLNSYTCNNGFFIERYLGKGNPDATSIRYEVGRRTQIQLTREANYILLEG